MYIDLYSNIEIVEINKVLLKYGNLIPYGLNGETLVDIMPGTSRTGNTLTTRYGFNNFPFHTDTAYWHLPAKFLVLYCKNPGSGGRETNFVDVNVLCKDDQFLTLSQEAIFLVKRNFKSFYSRALFKVKNETCFRYDIDCMTPQNDKASHLSKIVSELEKSDLVQKHKWSTGDLVIINNYNILHSRGSAVTNDVDRVLTRGLII